MPGRQLECLPQWIDVKGRIMHPQSVMTIHHGSGRGSSRYARVLDTHSPYLKEYVGQIGRLNLGERTYDPHEPLYTLWFEDGLMASFPPHMLEEVHRTEAPEKLKSTLDDQCSLCSMLESEEAIKKLRAQRSGEK